MSNRKQEAIKVAGQLHEAERKIDDAVSAAASLAVLMPQARLAANVSALVGQDALEAVFKALSHLGEARGALVASHRALTVAQGQMGLGALAFGGFIDKDDPNCGYRLQAVAA